MRNLNINYTNMLPITKLLSLSSRQFLYKSFTFLLWQVMQIATHGDCFFPSLKITYLIEFGINSQIE